MIENFENWLNEGAWDNVIAQATHMFIHDLPKGDSEETRKHAAIQNKTWDTSTRLAIVKIHDSRIRTPKDIHLGAYANTVTVLDRSGQPSFDTWMSDEEVKYYLKPFTATNKASRKFGLSETEE